MDHADDYAPSSARYGTMPYRPCGRSGLKLPAISLGMWQNFGGDQPFDHVRTILRKAFDQGITHFDLANNYGPPPGSSEALFGQVLATDFKGYRDELIVSTKAGWTMWPGPYGDGGSRKHLVASCDQSLQRLGVDYVDIFYSHRVDPDTPLEETVGALVQIHRQGKALYIGISSYSAALTRKVAKLLRDEGVPLLVNQTSYSMLNRWVEEELLDTLDELGMGCIAFSPLAQGLLTDKYLGGMPVGARASTEGSFSPALITPENIERVRHLNEIARSRGQTLAEMAVAWTLRDARVCSAIAGVRSLDQLDVLLRCASRLDFSEEELAMIDRHAQDGGLNLWSVSSDIVTLAS
jgi:L-glyceraldehyde 3-phosphate reductase